MLINVFDNAYQLKRLTSHAPDALPHSVSTLFFAHQVGFVSEVGSRRSAGDANRWASHCTNKESIMALPISIDVSVNSVGVPFSPNVNLVINSGMLTLIGPNGSGKTQLLRAIKKAIPSILGNKKVKYLSAGRIGLLEQFRSDYDGQRGSQPREAHFGSKDDTNRRHSYETMMGDFHTLSVRTDILVKVQERLKKLFNRSILLEWDAGTLKVSFKRNDQNNNTYSSSREASGLLHLIAILAALFDDEVGALLIDEPEVSLHPQLQAFLMREIRKYSGDVDAGKKIVIIATHSTEFIQIKSPSDLCDLVFCRDISETPIQILLDSSELKARKLRELLSRMGQAHKLAFFCKRPLLVEGPSDSILCNGIENRLDLYIEASGVQILPVIGKGEFPIVFNFLKLIGKEPVILTDADSFTDSTDVVLLYSQIEEVNRRAQSNGFSNFSAFVKSLYSDFCQIVDTEKVKYSSEIQQHNYWINRKKDDELVKIEKRAFFSILFTDDEEINKKISGDPKVSALRTRLETFLDMLEEFGCFILRRGTIESYYRYSDKITSEGKPLAAVEEIEKILGLSIDEIEIYYPEIVSCLRYSSRTKPINEIELLRELLLSVLAPSLAILGSTTTQSDIDISNRNILGDRSKLFNISIPFPGKNILRVELNSNIIDQNCFPFDVSKEDNLVAVIDKILGL